MANLGWTNPEQERAQEQPRGLAAFAAAHPTRKGPKCRTCRLKQDRPELWAELIAGRSRAVPVTYPTISQWLREEHNEHVTANQLRDHFHLGHEEAR